MFKKSMKNKTTYGIIGLGRFGMALALELAKADADLLVIDRDEEKVREMREYTENAFVVPTLDRKTLGETGIQNCDVAVVCIGESMSTSILTTLVSINALPAGAGVPFVHSHKENEEIYGILSGHGKAIIDGEEITLAAGDWLRIAPAAKRQFFAANDAGIVYVCVQVKANSLGGFTAEDAVVY